MHDCSIDLDLVLVAVRMLDSGHTMKCFDITASSTIEEDDILRARLALNEHDA